MHSASGRRLLTGLLALSAILLLSVSAFVPTVFATTNIPANANGFFSYFAGTTGDKLKGPLAMNFFSDQQICPSTSLPSPSDRLDVPLKLSGSNFNGINAPWNKSGTDPDGRHFYKWSFAGTTLNGTPPNNCFGLNGFGSVKIDPEFNITRKISPSTLTSTTTLVKVVAKIVLKTTVPQFCIGEFDFTTPNTFSNLTSISIKSSPLSVSVPLAGTRQVTQNDDFFQVCFGNPAPATFVVTSGWDVTKLVGGTVQWKPDVFGFISTFAFLGFNFGGSTITTSPTAIVYDANVLPQTHDTMTMSTTAAGVTFTWNSAFFNQDIFLDLSEVSVVV